MKLRLQGDTLRLRLTRPEVERLGRGEAVAATTRLDPATGAGITYAVETHAGPDVAVELAMDGRGNETGGARVTVRLPAARVAPWAADETGELEGVYGEAPLPAGKLAVSVEKDFACTHRTPGAEPPEPEAASGDDRPSGDPDRYPRPRRKP